MRFIIPWLRERDYAQHRDLDPGLPDTYRKWERMQAREYRRLQQLGEGPVLPVMVCPIDLERWADAVQREVDEQARIDFAKERWAMVRTENGFEAVTV